ncbi:MAG: hypothetical protein IPM91_06905 [Bacteroidetes bacterium]|jgi:hypothetical protein|nr:hypothetical protein [Bacteroidota bacterium]
MSNCSCDERYSCPPIQPQFQYLLEVAPNDSLVYTTLFNDSITFYLTNRSFSPGYEEKCKKKQYSGCQCEDCQAYAGILLNCDTAFTNKNHYSLRIDETSTDANIMVSSIMSIDFMSFRVIFNLLDANIIEPQPVFSPLLQLNGKTFTNVYYFKNDTINISIAQLPIWELFYTENEGVVGFSMRKNQKTYIIE